MTTVYVTKWALTRGILAWKTPGDGRNRVIEAIGKRAEDYMDERATLWDDERYLTFDEAIVRAEKMRTERIASLERSLAKMKALTFEVEE